MDPEMICEAWHTVTHYHLRLGPTVNGNAENFLEHAINTLNHFSKDLSQNPLIILFRVHIYQMMNCGI